MTPDDLGPVAPQPALGAPRPWSWQQLAGDISARFAGSPYRVTASDERIRVTADLADARFMAPAALRDVREVFTTEVVRSGSRARLVDSAQSVDVTAGADGSPRLVASGRGRVERGMVVRRTRRIEFGADAQGVGPKVDIDFSSAAVHDPVAEALAASGIKRALGGNVMGALIVGGICIAAVPVVLVVLLLQSLGIL